MSLDDTDDDYLSDKFLVDAATAGNSGPKSYIQLRKEAEQKSKLKNDQNKTKSRRQRELETREEGLSKSLFDRAKEEEEIGLSSGNKALSMMMKMGFKPGQALGMVREQPGSTPPLDTEPETQPEAAEADTLSGPSARNLEHIVEPIPLHEWTGKKGIGLRKRARSPSSTPAQRTAKMAKMAKEAEEISQQDYRNRARREYEGKRAEGRLGPAQRTCATLDEQAGKPFNVLWLDPNNAETFPPGLLDTLALRGAPLGTDHKYKGESIQTRLRRQMQADALQPLNDNASSEDVVGVETLSSEVIDEAIQFLRLQAQDRLQLVLAYLRDNHAYCFWCGVQYDDEAAMQDLCPGPDEESHD